MRQGSILSLSLFLLIMDPLLRELQSLSVGTSVNGMYAGGFLHADDIRTLSNNTIFPGDPSVHCVEIHKRKLFEVGTPQSVRLSCLGNLLRNIKMEALKSTF